MNLHCLAEFSVSEGGLFITSHQLCCTVCVVVGRRNMSFVVVIEDKMLKEFFHGPCSLDCSKAFLSEKDVLAGLFMWCPLHTFQQTRKREAHGAAVCITVDWWW